MAASGAAILLLALAVMSCCSLQVAHADTDCSTTLTGLAGCLGYLTNLTATPDQKTCCTPLKTELSTSSSLQCICQQANSSSSSAEFKNALGLPKRCNLSITVSEANCTTSSTSNSTSSPSSSDNAGFLTASPSSYLFISALFLAFVSLSV